MSGKPSEHRKWLKPQLFSASGYFGLIFWISVTIVLVITSLDIAGWISNLTILKSIEADWVPMKLITAVSFVISSLALIIIRLDFYNQTTGKVLSIVFATVLSILSLFTLYIYFYLLSTGHDSQAIHISFFSYFLSPGTRMAFLTAVCFLFTGLSVLFLAIGTGKASGLAHIMIIPVVLISYFAIVTYILGVYDATALGKVPVALNTGIAFLATGIVVMVMRPDTWLMKLYNLNNIGGIISSRLIPPAIILPIIIGWLRIHGERQGLFVSDMGVVLVAITYSICFLAMVLLTAGYVNKSDLKRQASEQIMRESEERFRMLAENVPDLITRFDRNLRLIYANPAFRERTGLSAEDLIGYTAEDYGASETAIGNWEKAARKVLESGKPLRLEHTNYWQNSKRVLDVHLVPEFGSDGEVISLLGISRDITERKQIEDTLRESREQLAAVFNGVSETLMLINLEGMIIAANDTAKNRISDDASGLAGKNIYDIIPVSFHSQRQEQIAEIIRTKKPVKLHDKLKDTLLDLTLYPVIDNQGNVVQLVSFAIDITERKKAEDVLLSQARMLEAVNDAVIGCDLNYRINYWNKGAERIYGWKADEIAGKKAEEVLRSDMSKSARESIYRTLMEGHPSITELVQYTRDNRKLIIEGYTIPLTESGGRITGFVAINHDITERKNAEDSLKISEQRLKSHIENSPLAVIEWGHDFVVTIWSGEAERIFGWARDEVIGLRIDELNMIFEEDIQIVEKTMKRLTGGKELKVVSENRNYTKQREIRNCIWYNSVLLDESGKMSSVMSLVEDVTEIRKVEKLLKRVSKKLWSVLECNPGIDIYVRQKWHFYHGQFYRYGKIADHFRK